MTTSTLTSPPTMIAHHASLALEADLRSTGAARALVACALEDTARAELIQDAALLVSEVVANAIRHGSGQVQLEIECHPGGVRIEVSDSSSILPQRRASPWHAEGGRGILLLDELASAWGVERTWSGKTVWFELCA